MAFVLLGVNVYSKQKFKDDVFALETQKRMRNNFSSAKFNIIYLYGISNIPKNFNYTQKVKVELPNKDLFSYFKFN